MIKMKEAGQTVIKFGSGALGLTVGSVALRQLNKLLPASLPEILKKVAPGTLTMLLAFFVSTKVSNEKAKAMLMGVGLSGFADVILKALGNMKLIADNVPALSGLPGYQAVNTGGVGWDYYRDNSLQGLAADPYALNGDTFSMQGLRGLGQSPYALSGDTFSMQGLGQGGAMSAMDAYALNG